MQSISMTEHYTHILYKCMHVHAPILEAIALSEFTFWLWTWLQFSCTWLFTPVCTCVDNV